jgi:hypothetical protein
MSSQDNTENYLLVALVGATINMILSTTMPCILKKSDQPFLEDAKKIFRANRNAILTSSLIIGITIFLSLIIVEDFSSESSIMGDANEMIFTISDNLDSSSPIRRICGKPGEQLSNLSRLSR